MRCEFSIPRNEIASVLPILSDKLGLKTERDVDFAFVEVGFDNGIQEGLPPDAKPLITYVGDQGIRLLVLNELDNTNSSTNIIPWSSLNAFSLITQD
jgi:hypothetical protein